MEKRIFVIPVFAFLMAIFTILSSTDASASFLITHECYELHCFADGKIMWRINITNTERETIYISRIRLRDILGNEIAHYDLKTEILFSETEIVAMEGTVPKATNYTYLFYNPCFTFFKREGDKIIEQDERCYPLKNITVMPKPIIRCLRESDCNENMSCERGLCFPVKCIECQYIKEHKCLEYECCSNEECLPEEYCSENSCTPLSCSEDEMASENKCRKFSCPFLNKPKSHECVQDKLLIIIFISGAGIIVFSIITLVLLKVRIGKKSIPAFFSEKRKAAFHKRMEEKLLKEIKVHLALMKYLKSEEEIKTSRNEIRKYEMEAGKHRKEWQRIMGVKICPECGSLVKSSLRLCPKCNEKLH
ncbi:MAG: hypothetical protein NTV63_00095 [Candidatus Woesearchaeota archaeon]|nr:hypothetical protein [Candidatus Woesearchaeota archaeon]